MSKDTTARDKSRATTDRIAKRAQWEAFEFAVPEPGTVRVENHSHGAENVDEHTYDVSIRHGSAVACTCPADEYNDEACKHRIAVEQNAPVLAAASGVVDDASRQPATDGGVVLDDETDDDGRPDDCECEPWMSDIALPCFECHRAGFETPNPDLVDATVSLTDGEANAHGFEWDADDRDRPQRSEPADFGGGESTGVQDLLGGDDA